MKLRFSILVFAEIILLLITHCTGQNIIITKPVLSINNDTPPFTHNLTYLAKCCDLYNDLSDESEIWKLKIE